MAWAYDSSAHHQGARLLSRRHALLNALAPYWQPHTLTRQWDVLVAMYRHAYARLPAMPGMRTAHINMLGALNALGMHLPVTLVLTACEIWFAKM